MKLPFLLFLKQEKKESERALYLSLPMSLLLLRLSISFFFFNLNLTLFPNTNNNKKTPPPTQQKKKMHPQLPQRHPPRRLRLRPPRPLRPRGRRRLRQPQVARLLGGRPRQVGHARRRGLHRARDPCVGRRDPAVALRGPLVQVGRDPARRHLRARLLGRPLLALLARGRRDAVRRAQEMAGLPPPGLAGQAVLPRHGERVQRVGRPGVPGRALVQHVQPGQDRGRHEGVEDQGGEREFWSLVFFCLWCFFFFLFFFFFVFFSRKEKKLFFSLLWRAVAPAPWLLGHAFHALSPGVFSLSGEATSNPKKTRLFLPSLSPPPLPKNTKTKNSSRTAGWRCSPSSATAPRPS